jgi:hypothetical protein
MPRDILRLGPFIGGLNTSSDPSAVADAELVTCTNMELDTDNSLKSRPPIQNTDDLFGTWTERIVLIGVGIFSAGTYVIGSNVNGVYQYSGGIWTLITNTFQAACMVQYADQVWLIAKPGSVNPGGAWDPVGGFVAKSNLPQGGAAIVYKERLFVVPGKNATSNTSRLVFSEPANFEDYNPTGGNQAAPGVDFIDVSKGDGQKLVDLQVYRGNLLLFKEDSTYVLAYETSPTDAVVENINPVVGATQERCSLVYENTVYLYHEGSVYEIVNYDFNKINVKCAFIYDGGVPTASTRVEPVFLGRIGDRLIVRYFNKIYAYGFRTRVWSEWVSASANLHNFGPIVGLPSNVAQSTNDIYYAGSSVKENKRVYAIRDGYDSTTDENFNGLTIPIACEVRTKNFDIGASHLFKRLSWWGADILSNNSVTGSAQPIVFSFQTTWGALKNGGITWSQLNTWGQPLTSYPSVSTAVATGSGTQRRFVKFPKTLRYRQINFDIKMTTNGTTTDGPARLYTIAIATNVRQTVAKAIN